MAPPRRDREFTIFHASTRMATLLRADQRCFFPLRVRKPWRSAVDKGSYGPEARDIARAILTYLAKNPEAKDTADGITRWWLQREWSGSLLREMDHAISLLRSKDILIETRRKGLPPYYHLNEARREEVSRMLEGP